MNHDLVDVDTWLHDVYTNNFLLTWPEFRDDEFSTYQKGQALGVNPQPSSTLIKFEIKSTLSARACLLDFRCTVRFSY